MSKKNRSAIPQSITQKANRCLKQLQGGLSFRQLHGKRLKCNPSLVSIPLGSYRLLCIYQHQTLCEALVLSHAAYDDCLRRFS